MRRSLRRKGHANASGVGMSFAWERVDALLDRLDVEIARAHGLGPLAARRRRLLGQEVPEALALEERSAAAAQLLAPIMLTRARAAYPGRLLLMKGPELARRYPGRARRFIDLDLLADNANEAQAALLAAGFSLAEDGEVLAAGHHHLQPLQLPGMPLTLEIHHRVSWPTGLDAPANQEIFAAAVPASIGVPGLLTPAPHQHAILIAAHGWTHIPLQTVRELIDVMVAADETDPRDLDRLATQWGFGKAWRSIVDAAEWLFDGGRKPMSVRLWARHLAAPREPTVAELYVRNWLSPFWLVSPGRALQRTAGAIGSDFKPEPGETWRHKRRQALLALRHPYSPQSEYAARTGWRMRRQGRGGPEHPDE